MVTLALLVSGFFAFGTGSCSSLPQRRHHLGRWSCDDACGHSWKLRWWSWRKWRRSRVSWVKIGLLHHFVTIAALYSGYETVTIWQRYLWTIVGEVNASLEVHHDLGKFCNLLNVWVSMTKATSGSPNSLIIDLVPARWALLLSRSFPKFPSCLEDSFPEGEWKRPLHFGGLLTRTFVS